MTSATLTITTYRRDTGELQAVISGPDIDLMTARLRDTVGWVAGRHDPTTCRVDLATGNIIPKE